MSILFSQKAFMLLKGREHGNVFWTTGGEYQSDWYELLFESDEQEEVQAQWHKHYHRSFA